jgi:hypothetical protein
MCSQSLLPLPRARAIVGRLVSYGTDYSNGYHLMGVYGVASPIAAVHESGHGTLSRPTPGGPRLLDLHVDFGNVGHRDRRLLLAQHGPRRRWSVNPALAHRRDVVFGRTRWAVPFAAVLLALTVVSIRAAGTAVGFHLRKQHAWPVREHCRHGGSLHCSPGSSRDRREIAIAS